MREAFWLTKLILPVMSIDVSVTLVPAPVILYKDKRKAVGVGRVRRVSVRG